MNPWITVLEMILNILIPQIISRSETIQITTSEITRLFGAIFSWKHPWIWNTSVRNQINSWILSSVQWIVNYNKFSENAEEKGKSIQKISCTCKTKYKTPTL